MRPLDPRVSTAAAWAALVLMAGCNEEATPASTPLLPAHVEKDPPAREFYPLTIGNVWRYHRAFTIVIEVIVGPPYKQVDHYEGVVERRLVGTDDIDGVEYVVERMTLTTEWSPDSRVKWARFRQDHAGFYVADVSRSEPPLVSDEAAAAPGQFATPIFRDALIRAAARAKRPVIARALRDHIRRMEVAEACVDPAPGPAPHRAGRPGEIYPGELLYLSYPLRPRATWFNRVEPFWVWSEVEAHEVLDFPAGRFPVYRIRVDNELMDPYDRVVAWYGRCGRLALAIHTETMALDVETGETARITTDEIETLTGLSLARHPLSID
jgi:hypothetical protein